MNTDYNMVFPVNLLSGDFRLSFRIDEKEEGVLLKSGTWLQCAIEENTLIIALRCLFHNEFLGENKEYNFYLKALLPMGAAAIELYWLCHEVRLYVDGVQKDAEWPLGRLDIPADEVAIDAANGVSALCLEDVFQLPAEEQAQFTGPMQFFLPPGSSTGVGDCMPFAYDGRYCLFYLLDRRGHRSKAGLGAHQWAQISSSDLKTWTIHPMAIPITAQWEGSICTGSLIHAFGKIYAFYAVRMADGSPARMTWAVSEDGVRFSKSGEYFALKAPYEPVSARDPMVFLGADGLFHMLVTTELVGDDAPEYPGCLAHLSSPDLMNWTQLQPFIVPGYPDQPECSDYFEWNGYYYLVFSNAAIARYRYSKEPFGPFIKPEQDVLDTRDGQVAKTAAFGTRRFSTGFLTPYPRTYGGYAVTHELVQRPDGTLCAKFLQEILPPDAADLFTGAPALSAPQGREVFPLGRGLNVRLRGTMAAENPAMRFGLQITDEEGQAYHIDFNAAQRRIGISRPGQAFMLLEGRNQLLGVDGLHEAFSIDLIVFEEALDLCVNEERVITIRSPRAGQVQIALYAMWGTLRCVDMRLTELAPRTRLG